VWGTPSVGTQRRQSAFVGLNGTPNYVEVDGGKDVLDVAVGESHAVALTTDACVYVLGGNENGQLGLGRGFGIRWAEEWTRVKTSGSNISEGHRVVGVAAGPRCSFLITASSAGSDGIAQ
jgi:regulator of chromosome condensation